MSIDPNFDFGIFKQTLPDSDINLQEIQAEVAKQLGLLHEDNENNGLFLVKTAQRWIEQARIKPIPRMLFSEFWLEGQLCILFADTGLGKSVLAVQIADSISRGEVIKGFKLEAAKKRVLLFDFELSDKQFESRYSNNYRNHYVFDENFLRAEINPDSAIPDGYIDFESYLTLSLEQAIGETRASVLIVDNLTYLRDETERAKNALPLMKHLKALKSRYGLSILALAHTPKRDLSKPITRNDLQGSKMLINFCDSAFAIGESFKDKNLRYFKQIKPRDTELIYDTENICVCQLEKPDNFLRFEFLSFGSEREHLRVQSEDDKAQLIVQVKQLSKEGKSQRQIAGELQISPATVNRYLKK